MKASELIMKLQSIIAEHGDLDVEVNARMTSGKEQRWDKIPCTDAYVCGGNNKAVILDALD
jgi:hypothetical protein